MPRTDRCAHVCIFCVLLSAAQAVARVYFLFAFTNEFVAIELLACLQQNLDVMTNEVSVAQIYATNFSENDIAAAKPLLFSVLNKSKWYPASVMGLRET